MEFGGTHTNGSAPRSALRIMSPASAAEAAPTAAERTVLGLSSVVFAELEVVLADEVAVVVT